MAIEWRAISVLARRGVTRGLQQGACNGQRRHLWAAEMAHTFAQIFLHITPPILPKL
jgi:hypothetical protein